MPKIGFRGTGLADGREGWMRSLAVAMAVMLGACASKVTAIPIQITKAHEDATHAAVRAVLKDPNSAMFGPAVAAQSQRTPGMIRVCGTVNARNSFGGYTGPVRYVANISDVAGVIAPVDAAVGGSPQDFGVNVLCAQAGL